MNKRKLKRKIFLRWLIISFLFLVVLSFIAIITLSYTLFKMTNDKFMIFIIFFILFEIGMIIYYILFLSQILYWKNTSKEINSHWKYIQELFDWIMIFNFLTFMTSISLLSWLFVQPQNLDINSLFEKGTSIYLLVIFIVFSLSNWIIYTIFSKNFKNYNINPTPYYSMIINRFEFAYWNENKKKDNKNLDHLNFYLNFDMRDKITFQNFLNYKKECYIVNKRIRQSILLALSGILWLVVSGESITLIYSILPENGQLDVYNWFGQISLILWFFIILFTIFWWNVIINNSFHFLDYKNEKFIKRNIDLINIEFIWDKNVVASPKDKNEETWKHNKKTYIISILKEFLLLNYSKYTSLSDGTIIFTFNNGQKEIDMKYIFILTKSNKKLTITSIVTRVTKDSKSEFEKLFDYLKSKMQNATFQIFEQ